MIVRAVVLAAIASSGMSLMACAGREIPQHDGYREGQTTVWKKPTALEFDEDFEAEVDGELSYPKRKRVRWFAVNLPDDGALEIQLTAAPAGAQSSDVEDSEDVDVDEDPFDMGLELYSPNFKVLARADREDEDVGERRKTRVVEGLPKGRYLLHIYVHRRLDEAEYTVRVRYRRGAAEADTGFPMDVPYVGDLPLVPAFDDAPDQPQRCQGKGCRRVAKKPDSKPQDKPAEQPEATPLGPGIMKAKIIVIRGLASGGTTITLNRGSSQGVQPGWRGHVVTKSGKAIPGGDFTIAAAKNTSSTATVKLSSDAVKESGYATLKAP